MGCPVVAWWIVRMRFVTVKPLVNIIYKINFALSLISIGPGLSGSVESVEPKIVTVFDDYFLHEII